MKHVPAAKLETESRLLPKIWADGVHDDVPGLIAAFRNEIVEFDGEIVAPDMPVNIQGRSVAMSCQLLVLGEGAADEEPADGWIIVRLPKPHRPIAIEFCTFVLKRTA